MKILVSKIRTVFIAVVLLTLSFSDVNGQQPKADKKDRQAGQEMLKAIKSDIKKHYYDPNLRGIDIETKFQEASEKVEQAASLGQIMGIIAQTLTAFDDSHTRFLPPSRTSRTEYGWTIQAIGDKCFVTAVKPKSDAETKGLKVGDEILAIDNFGTSRENLWKLRYYYYSLRPQPGMSLLVRRPNGKEEEIRILAKVTTGRKVVDLTNPNEIFDMIRKQESEDSLNRHRYITIGDSVFIWKMPQFDMTEVQVDEMMSKVKKYPSLILDLRGNGGGLVKMLNRLAGHFFDRDVKIADFKGRKELDPQIAKTRGDKFYKGKVVVLIDSDSGSAAEIFARLMQLEKRGAVLGDRSAGAVMMSRYHQRQLGVDVVSFFGTSITEADVIMTDGKSLEKTGVAPDETILPTAQELAGQKDKIMVRAAEILGLKMEAAEAGKMFPVEWAK